MDPLLAAAAADLIKFETAVLALVTIGLLILAKIVSDLRAEVRSLRESRGTRAPVSFASPAPAAVTPPAAPPAAALVPAPDDEIPADIFTAIVSAVHFTLGDGHHVVSVSPAGSLAWSREGRRSIFRSHTFR